jgi:hypothetical protein
MTIYVRIDLSSRDFITITVHGETHQIDVPLSYKDDLYKHLTDIKLGLAKNDIDTTDPDIITQMQLRGVHVALAPYYIETGGCIYRRMTPPSAWKREMSAIISEFEEEQAFLQSLVDDGFKVIAQGSSYDYINTILRVLEYERELESGRIPCIGKDFGCENTTNGSQYCCKTYCPCETAPIN